MCSYFSKTESESSLAMKKASEVEKKENLGFKERMKKLALAFYLTCSVYTKKQFIKLLWVRKAEGYAHHFLLLLYPFHRGNDQKTQEDNLYSSKLNNPDILEKGNGNKEKFKPSGDLVDIVLISHNYMSHTVHTVHTGHKTNKKSMISRKS